MEVAGLRNRIQALLDPNADTRLQAELDLKYVRIVTFEAAIRYSANQIPSRQKTNRDLHSLFSTSSKRNRTLVYDSRVCSYGVLYNLPVIDMISAVVYLKNRINRGWASGDDVLLQKPIPEDEKLSFRNRLLPIIASSPPQIRSQLVPILQKILQYDFPNKWPNFMENTLQLLSTNDADSVYAGLQCMLAISRTYRFKAGENREDFNKIVQVSFDQLLNIGNRLVDETSIEAGEMLRIVIKTYKHAIYVCDYLRNVLDSNILIVAVRTPRPSDGPGQHGWLVYAVHSGS